MRRTLLAMTALTTILLAFAGPALAQNESDTDVVVNPPDEVDVDVNDNDGAEESTFAGLSTTVVIVLIVLAVLVVALIVAMASRGP